jgi:hypothetical protein
MRGDSRRERVRAALLGAVAALIPVFMTDARSGTAGLLAEGALLFGAALVMCRRSDAPVRPGVFLLVGALVAEMIAVLAHRGFAVFAGTWAPAGSQLLVAVPAVLAGGAIGVCLRDRAAGWVVPAVAALAGASAGFALVSSVVAAIVFLAASAAAVALLRPRKMLMLSSLVAGAAGLVAVAVYFTRPGGPGNMWPVVLPVQALIVTPAAYAGGALGMLIARVTRREQSEASAGA